MSDQRQRQGGQAPPSPRAETVPARPPSGPGAVETWDDATRLDPPGTIHGRGPADTASSLSHALKSPLPSRSDVPPPKVRPAPPRSAPHETAPDARETARVSPVGRPAPQLRAPSGPFGVDATELDLDLWAVSELAAVLEAAPPSTADAAPRDPALVERFAAAEPARDLGTGLTPPASARSADGAATAPLTPSSSSPPSPPSLPSPPPSLASLPSGDPAARPVDPDADLTVREGNARLVLPAGPAVLQDPLDEPPLPRAEVPAPAFETHRTLLRLGRLSVSKARGWLKGEREPDRRSLWNPAARPGGVGMPVGAARKRGPLPRALGIFAVLLLGALLGFIVTVAFLGR